MTIRHYSVATVIAMGAMASQMAGAGPADPGTSGVVAACIGNDGGIDFAVERAVLSAGTRGPRRPAGSGTVGARPVAPVRRHRRTRTRRATQVRPES